MEFTVKLADINIAVKSLYSRVFNLCQNYITSEPADFSVTISKSDIDNERKRSIREATLEKKQPVNYPDDYLETLAVYRKIATRLPYYNALLIHGSVIGLNGSAYMFTAPSGVGKTTHTGFWLKQFTDAFVINGDKPIIRLSGGSFFACGTPWSGKENLNRNTKLPLKSICFLSRSEQNSIEPVAFKNIYPNLFQQTFRPDNETALRKTMELIKQLGGEVPLYILRCNLDPASANIAYEGMNK